MFKSYLAKFPLWFIIVWSCVVIAFILLIATGFNPVIMMGGMVILYIANAIRAWEKERLLAIVSCVLAVVFSYIFYKFLML